MAEDWQPTISRYAVDRAGRLGRVTGSYLGSIYLRPPGGGREWSAAPEELQEPTTAELARARILSTPVPATSGRELPARLRDDVVLSADYGLRPRPTPVPDCQKCASLAKWFDHYMSAGPMRDESAAVDCVVEIRNHPHTPPKMTIQVFAADPSTDPLPFPDHNSNSNGDTNMQQRGTRPLNVPQPWVVRGGQDDSSSGNKHGGGGSEGEDSGHSDTKGSGNK